jgi:hypothetical protein
MASGIEIAKTARVCHAPGVPKLPDTLQTSPLTITCPSCGSEPGEPCMVFAEGLSGAVRLERVQEAAAQDSKRRPQ